MNGNSPAARFPEHWDCAWIKERIRKEASRPGYYGQAPAGAPGRLPLPYRLLAWGLKVVGLFPRGYRNYLDVQVRQLRHELPAWPASLDGYRILQIADSHIDLDPGLLAPLCGVLQGLEAELVVFTGDFRENSSTGIEEALAGTEALLAALPPPRDGVFGVPGNHDSIALCAALEERGIRLLINEARTIGSGATAFALAGVDDPYFFKLENVGRAASQCATGLPRILLSHSPQIAGEANAAGFHFMLSGHTHGGQICLPGGLSFALMRKVPRQVFAGKWRVDALCGYTSTGAGACHVPVRFNCPPEVVVHSLHPSP